MSDRTQILNGEIKEQMPLPDVIFSYECIGKDSITGDTKRIAFDSSDLVSIEQCWLNEAISDDEVVKVEAVNVTFKSNMQVAVKAKFEEMLELWKISRGWPIELLSESATK